MLYSSHALYTSYLFAGNKLHQHTFTVYSTTLQLHRQSTSVAYRFVIHNHLSLNNSPLNRIQMANGNLWEKNISDTVLDVEHKNVLIINTLK